jgi:hypothetical protein
MTSDNIVSTEQIKFPVKLRYVTETVTSLPIERISS